MANPAKKGPACGATRKRLPRNILNGLWDGRRQGICARIRLCLAGRADYPHSLPDEDLCRKKLGGTTALYFDDGFDKAQSLRSAAKNAALLHDALCRFLLSPGKRRARELYLAVTRKTLTTGEFSALRKKIVGRPLPNPKLAAELAERLAARGPDRDAVAFGLALMHASPPGRHTRTLDTLMTHGRFMWMALWAGVRGMERRRELLTVWEAVKKYVLPPAKSPTGVPLLQGCPENIHLANRLFDSGVPEIAHWLLRGFYRLYLPTYIAYGCAGGGGLLTALRRKSIDRRLLFGAGEILAGMIVNFESVIAEGENDEGAARALYLWERHLAETGGNVVEAVSLWLDHVEAGRRADLGLIQQMAAIRGFCRSPKSEWERPPPKCWTGKTRRDMARRISRILAEERWHALVRKKMARFDDYYEVFSAAMSLGVDVWEYRFRAHELGHEVGGHIFLAISLRKSDAVQKRRLLELMEKQIDMNAFALGPGDEEAIGRNWYCVMRTNASIVRTLAVFPGTHPEYIVAAMTSPDKRYRLPAANAMRAWGPSLWTEDMLQALRKAIKTESFSFRRKFLRRVLGLRKEVKAMG